MLLLLLVSDSVKGEHTGAVVARRDGRTTTQKCCLTMRYQLATAVFALDVEGVGGVVGETV